MNRANIFTNDLLLNYATHLDVLDIKSLCLIDKNAQDLYNNKHLWKVKIDHYMSQYKQFDNNKYVGDYTESAYNIVVNAINKTELLYDKYFIIKFYNNENLNMLGINLLDYKPSLYDTQVISVQSEQCMISCYYKHDGIKYTIKSDQYIYKPTNIYVFIFNIFYYFPYINYTIPVQFKIPSDILN